MGLKVITDWYSPNDKPRWDRPGSYLTCWNDNVRPPVYVMLHWNGFHWMTIDKKIVITPQYYYWCGLAFNPEDCGINSNGEVILYNPKWESNESTKRS